MSTTCEHFDQIRCLEPEGEVTGHPVIRSVEPGEEWSWCYEDELMFRLAGA